MAFLHLSSIRPREAVFYRENISDSELITKNMGQKNHHPGGGAFPGNSIKRLLKGKGTNSFSRMGQEKFRKWEFIGFVRHEGIGHSLILVQGKCFRPACQKKSGKIWVCSRRRGGLPRPVPA